MGNRLKYRNMAEREGFESALKCSFNNMQSNGRQFKQCRYMEGSANGR